MRSQDEITLSELIDLRRAVFGADRAYTDELAELLHYEEEPQREMETDETYNARVKRVSDRKARLGVE